MTSEHERNRAYIEGEKPSFLRDVRAETDAVRQVEYDRAKAVGAGPAAPKPVTFVDQFLQIAAKHLNPPTPASRLNFVLDVAQLDTSSMTFQVALELARRISISPVKNGPEQGLARRASAAFETARSELQKRGFPGQQIAEVADLLAGD